VAAGLSFNTVWWALGIFLGRAQSKLPQDAPAEVLRGIRDGSTAAGPDTILVPDGQVFNAVRPFWLSDCGVTGGEVGDRRSVQMNTMREAQIRTKFAIFVVLQSDAC
jgi:hypothetical protein